VKDRQIAIFLDPASSAEDREEAHSTIRALSKIDTYIESVLTDEKIFDKTNT